MFRILGRRIMLEMPERESKEKIVLTEGYDDENYYKDTAIKFGKIKVTQVGDEVVVIKRNDFVYVDPRIFEASLFYKDPESDIVYMIIDERQVIGVY